MEIHKPKPWHNIREFAKEYLIIVVGVLTALAGEAAVERLHRANEVREARSALQQEVGRDMAALILEVREDRCMAAMLTEFENWAKGGPKPALKRDLLMSMRTSVWDAMRGGAVPNMELKDRLALADLYGGMENQNWIVNRARDLMADVRGYYNQDTLSAEDAQGLLRAVGRAKPFFEGEASNAPRLLKLGRDLGATPGGLELSTTERVDELCRAAGVTG